MIRLAISFSLAFVSLFAAAQESLLFVGTYTGSGSKGIYTYAFNTRTGKARLVSHTDSGSVQNPSFLALSPDKQHLYAVNETGGDTPGTLSTYSVDPDGTLLQLDKLPTGGDHPCYVSVSPNGRWVIAGNYSGGNLAAFPLDAGGTVQPYAQLVQHQGTGPNTARQEKAHVHAAVFDPGGQHLLVPDLGADKVFVYKFNAGAAQPLTTAEQPFAASLPGSGPRHLAFHPSGRYVYLMEELSGTVTAYRYAGGKLSTLQRLSSHPEDYNGPRGSADIHVSADGKFLYASNRGEANSIGIFSIGTGGKLKWVGSASSGGRTPRNFTLAPGGRFLLVANQDSGNIVIMKRDAATGKLTPTGEALQVPKPVCLLFK